MRFPFRKPCVDVKRAVAEIDLRIRLIEVQAGHQRLVLESERCLEQPGHAGARVEMSEVTLNGTERAKLFLSRAQAEGLRERGDLNRITHHGPGAVSFNVAYCFGFHSRDCESFCDDFGLPLHARSREAYFV